MKKTHLKVQLVQASLAYTLYENDEAEDKSSKLVLLHGAGVAGELTWAYVAHYLKNWHQILVPDFPNAGQSYFLDEDLNEIERACQLEEISNSVIDLLSHLSWQQIDLVGYSLGGLIALDINRKTIEESDCDLSIGKFGLIEPALFSAKSETEAKEFRASYKPIAEQVLRDPESKAPFLSFLNKVSPNRIENPQADEIALKRLMQRPLGFAYSVSAVSEFIERNDSARDDLIAHLSGIEGNGVGIVGELSDGGLLEAQEFIASKINHWDVHVVPKADHGLVYLKPKKIANILNQL